MISVYEWQESERGSYRLLVTFLRTRAIHQD